MIIRHQISRASALFLLCSLIAIARADDSSADDCHPTAGDAKYDLTSLAGEHMANRTRTTPPSTMLESLRFNVCGELKRLDGMSDDDQCQTGTRACLTKINQKSGNDDRVIAVIPIADSQNLPPTYASLLSPKALSIQFHGPEYLNPSGVSARQTLNVTIICDSQGVSEPKFIAYDLSRLDIEWSTPAGCAVAEGDAPNDDNGQNGNDPGGEEENVGSGIGWFFLVMLLAILAYFGLGAYYNYSTYGARGADLIPHRDFWKEVPYMFSDVFSHLCSSVRPRRTANRGGYISV